LHRIDSSAATRDSTCVRKRRGLYARKETDLASPFEVRIVDWDAARADARPVRHTVFVVEQQVPLELEWDDRDAVCDHAIAYDAAGRPIGTGRLLPDARIGRMAVVAEWRGKGVGAAILAALLERARQRGKQRVTLHAQTHAAGFYAKYGFVTEGAVFIEADIPHVTMTRTLPAGERS
jgi:predicted GNAT family N-acyltransferase